MRVERNGGLRSAGAARTLFLFALVMLVSAMGAVGQNAPAPVFTPPPPTPNDSLRSPEVLEGGHVMFRIYAPEAKKVLLKAEGHESTPGLSFAEYAKFAGGETMTRGEDGVWSINLGPIQPGVYRYTFLVDGVATVDPRNPWSSESLNNLQSMYEVPGAAFSEYKPDVPHGAIASVWYESAATKGMRRMHVYTPPGYGVDGKAYPVLYLLHGGGDTDDSWGTVGRAGAILDNLIASGKAKPMLIVMPAGHVLRSFRLQAGSMRTMGHDEFNEDLVGSVIPYIEKNYKTMADRDHRALAGLSMGGLQTLTVSLNNSELFSYVGVFSSGWFANMLADEEKTDLAQYKAGGKPFKLYWVGLGKLDIAYTNGLASIELLKKYGVTPVYHESGGFHAWNNWRDYLAIFAPQLFQ